MIGIAMSRWPDEALRRVLDAPLETWRPRAFLYEDGARCLVGHAADATLDATHGRLSETALTMSLEWEEGAMRYLRLNTHVSAFGSWTFDRLCTRFGIPRTVRAIKARALRELLSRHPLDSKLVVLRAEVGT